MSLSPGDQLSSLLSLLVSVRRTVRCSSASTTAPPSSPTSSTWWSSISSTEECCPASSNTPAPLWPCDTPHPQHHHPFFLHTSHPEIQPSPICPFLTSAMRSRRKVKLSFGDVNNSAGAGINAPVHFSALQLFGCLNGNRSDSSSVADCGPSSRPAPATLAWRLGCFVIALLTLERDHMLMTTQDS